MRIDSGTGRARIGSLAVAAGIVAIALAACAGGDDDGVPFDRSPTVSREGYVAFVRGSLGPDSQIPDSESIFVARGSSDPERLTDPGYAGDDDPAWSPDGSSVVFVRSLGLDGYGLYVVNRDGSGLRELTRTAARGVFQILSAPAWSPDGKRIAFVWQAFGSGPDLYVIAADGRHRRLVAAVAESPSWAPDGLRLAYVWGEGFGIRVLDVRRGTVKTVTRSSGGLVGALAWSPDGKRLAYEDRGEIYTMKLNGSRRRRLTSDRVWDGEPAWTPDGRIVFSRGGSGLLADYLADYRGRRIYVMKADGTGMRPLLEP